MKQKQPLILVTNDDGIHAPGIKALFEAMQDIGRPVMIAPERDKSAVSHSLTMDRPLRVKKIQPDRFAMDGTPTDCVTIGISKVLTEKPALVVSGINPGGNLGDDISYSGTVSAAIEGTMLGVPAIAFSVAGEEPFLFETAGRFAARIAKHVLLHGLPRDTLLNVNVPNCVFDKVAGIRFTRQGRRLYNGAIKETVDPWGRQHFWIGGGTPSWDKGEDTDSQAVLHNFISVTPLHLDLTNHEALADLQRNWQDAF